MSVRSSAGRMRRVLLILCIRGLLLTGLPMVTAAQGVQQAYEEAAGALEFFSWHDFLYDRDLTAAVTPEKAEQYNRTMERLFRTSLGGLLPGEPNTRPRPTQAILDLLGHGDPKVRTLAMAALFAMEDPKLLPKIAALAKDEASTFPSLELLASAAFIEPRRAPPMKPQTVGAIAREMVRFYMERSGYFYGIEGYRSNPGFEDYWNQRKDRSHCLGWFEVLLDRATQGQSPIQRERLLRIRRVRRRVDQLPPVEREMTLLALFAGRDLQGALSEKDLVFAARRLGPQRLMRVLHGDVLTDDPDLPYRILRVQHFLLGNAKSLLRPSDAASLWNVGRQARRHRWFIAAAELQPSRAAGILHEAFEQCKFLHNGRTETALALWRLVGPPESKFLLDWFYRDGEPRLGRPPYRAEFVAFLLDRFESQDRRLLATLIEDSRFAELDWSSLKVIVRGLNRNLLHPVVRPRELEEARHPLGESHFHGMMDRAKAKYPKETAELLARLSGWRDSIRGSVTDWAEEPH